MSTRKHTLEVWGDLACFTRPEMKVERFSYPVITPSAARGIFDAIYWEGIRDNNIMKPYFHWQINRIEILNYPRFISFRRNEVKDKAPADSTIKSWMSGKKTPEPLLADAGKEEVGTDQKGRTQRQTIALKDVRYRITASIVPKSKFSAPEQINKFDCMFERRAKQGKCFQQPFFGCSEFPAFFEYVTPDSTKLTPIPYTQDIGWMLYDVFDLNCESVKNDAPYISLFNASVVDGILDIPSFNSDFVKKPERR